LRLCGGNADLRVRSQEIMDDLKFNLYVGTQAAATLVLLALAALWPGPWNTQRMVGSALLMVGMVLVLMARF
jgi:hypothetical protein